MDAYMNAMDQLNYFSHSSELKGAKARYYGFVLHTLSIRLTQMESQSGLTHIDLYLLIHHLLRTHCGA